MRFTTIAMVSLLVATPAFAQEAPATAAPAATAALSLRPGMTIVSADGRRIGRVERVFGDSAAPTGVSVIKDSKFVTIPASTLSTGDHGRLVTSLNAREIR